MELTKTEENKNRIISGIVTGTIFGLLLLFLILFQLITPNPPFPEVGGGGGQELALGMMNVGSGDIDYGSMGQAANFVVKETPKDEVVTVEGGEEVDLDK